MKKVWLKVACCLLALGLIILGVMIFAIPNLPASWLWSSGDPDCQEMAIPKLMKQIKVGMSPEEVSRLFGVTIAPARPYMGGCEIQSFNVNSWYNRGIDVIYTNGFVRKTFEYD